jgi:hypothetical protein
MVCLIGFYEDNNLVKENPEYKLQNSNKLKTSKPKV